MHRRIFQPADRRLFALRQDTAVMRFHLGSCLPSPFVFFMRGIRGLFRVRRERPKRDAPGMRPSAQDRLTRRSATPQRNIIRHNILYTNIRSFASADAKAGNVGEETGARTRQAKLALGKTFMEGSPRRSTIPTSVMWATPMAHSSGRKAQQMPRKQKGPGRHRKYDVLPGYPQNDLLPLSAGTLIGPAAFAA